MQIFCSFYITNLLLSIMTKYISIGFEYLRAFIIIFIVLFIGNAIAKHLPFSVPGSIIGLLILFLLLATHVIPPHWVKSGCQIFIRFMAILFIPASIGIMKYYNVLMSHFGPIVIACFVSTFVVLLITGYLTEYLHRNNKETDQPEEKL